MLFFQSFVITINLQQEITKSNQFFKTIINISYLTGYIGGADPRVQIYKPNGLTYNGIIFVVDCNDKDRFECTATIFHRLLTKENFKELPILILANKKDLIKVNLQELTRDLMLEKLANIWHIQPCCAVSKEGIEDGLKWMQMQLK